MLTEGNKCARWLLSALLTALSIELYLVLLLATVLVLSGAYPHLSVQDFLLSILVIFKVFMIPAWLCFIIALLAISIFCWLRGIEINIAKYKITGFGLFAFFYLIGTIYLSASVAGVNYPSITSLVIVFGIWTVLALITIIGGDRRLIVSALVVICLLWLGGLCIQFVGVKNRPNNTTDLIGTSDAIFSDPVISTNVILAGIDGGTWKIILPMARMGRLPVMELLMHKGSYGVLESIEPMESPRIWNSIATGLTPQDHGIMDFMVYRIPGTSKFIRNFPPLLSIVEASYAFPAMPATSEMRKAHALWDIASAAGISCGVVGWWATWPASKINGFMVSDRIIYSRFNMMEAGEELNMGQTYPPALFDDLKDSLFTPLEVASHKAREFLSDIKTADLDLSTSSMHPQTQFLIGLAGMETYHRIGNELYRRFKPRLFCIYYEGIDSVSHFFYRQYDPSSFGNKPGEFTREQRLLIPRYYAYQDAILDELLEAIAPNTAVILCSDHGFQPANPQADTYFLFRRFPTHSGLHHPYGFFIAADTGDILKDDQIVHGASIYDIPVTVLYLLGIPPAEDMPGRLLREAISAEYLDKHPLSRIASYGRRQAIIDLPQPSLADDQIRERLKGLGYLK